MTISVMVKEKKSCDEEKGERKKQTARRVSCSVRRVSYCLFQKDLMEMTNFT